MSLPLIHPTAVIDPAAELGNNVRVGAYTVIGEDVAIGDDCDIAEHVSIQGPLQIGRNNRISPFCALGGAPQHMGHKGEPTRVEIGDDNILREYVSIHRGTMLDAGVTRIGSRNLLMAYVHVAHDCVIGNDINMANGASMAGHAHIGDQCILGGFALVYQFTHVGRLAYLGFGSHVTKDVPPFIMVNGQPARPHAVNSEGMRRRGFAADDIRQVKQAYRLLYRNKLLLKEARQAIAELPDGLAMQAFRTAINADSKRGLIR